VSCADLPSVQIGARGVLIEFAFVELDEEGNEVAVPLAGAVAAGGYAFAQFVKPGRGVERRFLQVVTPDTEGRAVYATEGGFLDEAGEWEAQGFVRLASGTGQGFFPSKVVRFEVLANLPGVSFPAMLTPDPVRLPLVAGEPLRFAS
jgi:hypothetical protein